MHLEEFYPIFSDVFLICFMNIEMSIEHYYGKKTVVEAVVVMT